MEPKDSKKDPKEWDGVWQDSDSFETNPEFQDMHEEFIHSFFSKEDPEYLEMLKRLGFDANEEPAKED
jgi:hypothetical protein